MRGKAGFDEGPDLDRWAQRKMEHLMSERGRGHRRGHGRPPWGGFGRFPGEFLGPGPRVGRGDVRAAIVVLLAEGPMHGYQVIQELTERSGGMWRPSPGSVYPTLQQLEDEGLVRSSEADGRRVFQLTDTGRAEVEHRKDEPPPWEMPSQAGQFRAVRDELRKLVAAAAQVLRTANPKQLARAKGILGEARKGLYRLLAEDEEPDQGTGKTD
jgi:DNA-binding PadR family transcriptional regulator